MKDSRTVLLVDDEEQILLSFSTILKTSGFESVITLSDSRKVKAALQENDIFLVVLDLMMPHISGTDLLPEITRDHPGIPVIVVTATNEIDMAVSCMRSGAFDYLVKPVEKSKFISSVRKAFEIHDLRQEISSLRKSFHSDSLSNKDAFTPYITQSSKMQAIFRYAEAVAATSKPVCIFGETGVGKELLANIIYRITGLEGEFIPVNVAGLDDTMFSDTLFGHKKGAFTGAERDREGMIARASGGVLLLDEIGDLSESSQVKLLRLLEEMKYYPLGSDMPEKSDVRIFATTNRNLEQLVADGKFRRDLYYRLCTHSVCIPPLRERREDIPLLLDHFLQLASESVGKKRPAYPRELIIMLSNYDFPGNVRELQAMVFDAVAQHVSGILSMNAFERFMAQRGRKVVIDPDKDRNAWPSLISSNTDFPTLKEAEAMLIREALTRSQGNQSIAASMLGITRQALNKRLKRKKET